MKQERSPIYKWTILLGVECYSASKRITGILVISRLFLRKIKINMYVWAWNPFWGRYCWLACLTLNLKFFSLFDSNYRNWKSKILAFPATLVLGVALWLIITKETSSGVSPCPLVLSDWMRTCFLGLWQLSCGLWLKENESDNSHHIAEPLNPCYQSFIFKFII